MYSSYFTDKVYKDKLNALYRREFSLTFDLQNSDNTKDVQFSPQKQ